MDFKIICVCFKKEVLLQYLMAFLAYVEPKNNQHLILLAWIIDKWGR